MINLVSAAVIAGVLSASGAAFIVDLSNEAEQASGAYVASAQERFEQYNAFIPGVAVIQAEAVKKDQ